MPDLIFPLMNMTIISVVLILAFIYLYFRNKERDRAHKERMALAEKGIEIPPELYPSSSQGKSDFTTLRVWLLIIGIVLIFMSIGMHIVPGSPLYFVHDNRSIVGFAMGIGFIVAERVIAKVFTRPDSKK